VAARERSPEDRGPFVSVYGALIDSPEYDALSRDGASVLWTLKCSPENGITGIMRVFPDQIARRSKIKAKWVPGALRELEESNWIKTEGSWVWIRNHLRFDPYFRPDNPNHVTGLVRKMAALPRIGLVCEFIRYYKSLGFLPPELECRGRNPDPVSVSVTTSVTTTTAVTVSARVRGRAKAAANPAASNAELASPEYRALIDAYNAAFESKIGYSPGNLKAAARMFVAGYTLDQAVTVFDAVKESRTATAAWCHDQNHEFEYLVRPTYVKHGQQVTPSLDKVLNELATGRRTERREA
jgi:hypothetical protein